MQIQGSGRVVFPDKKELRLGYAGQNGYRYDPIGKFLTDKIPLEEMSMASLENYLRGLPADEMQKILNQNASYVFFKKLDGKPVTFLGSEAVPGRTIATDKRYFPKGTLAYLEVDAPVFDDDKNPKPARFAPAPRLVIDADTGGAIRGGGRVDLYWGEGESAARSAGVMKQKGRLWYLIPKGIVKKNQPLTYCGIRIVPLCWTATRKKKAAPGGGAALKGELGVTFIRAIERPRRQALKTNIKQFPARSWP
jgi:membrane-bound lytic murein transglycosylase A